MLIFQCLYHLRCECSQWVALLNKTHPSHFNTASQVCSIPVHYRVTSWLMSRLFVWCGATTQIGHSPSIFEVTRSHTIRHTHTHTLGFIWTSDQLVTGAATYTAHDKHNRRTFISSAGFETAIPEIKRLQTYALDRVVTGMGADVSLLHTHRRCCAIGNSGSSCSTV